MAGLPPLDSAQMEIVQELEIEMMSDMYHRMINACHRKCIPSKYKEADLGKGEAVCLDRCVAKYLDIHDCVGKKLSQFSLADDGIMKKLQTEQQNANT